MKASIQAAVVMLKGVEDENERRARLEKERKKKEGRPPEVIQGQ